MFPEKHHRVFRKRRACFFLLFFRTFPPRFRGRKTVLVYFKTTGTSEWFTSETALLPTDLKKIFQKKLDFICSLSYYSYICCRNHNIEDENDFNKYILVVALRTTQKVVRNEDSRMYISNYSKRSVALAAGLFSFYIDSVNNRNNNR